MIPHVIKLVVAYDFKYDVISLNSDLEQMINIEVNVVVTMVFGQIYTMSCGKQSKG
jgi:hypothetical protein